jgi:hypothetical protein
MVRSHLRHVVEHIERVRSGHTITPNPGAVYLGGEDGDHFWELVGLRLTGVPTVVLAAMRFRRHDLPGIDHARESLASYLSSPPSPRHTDEPGTIPVLLPSAREKIPTFLAGLRAGRVVPPVQIDPAHIQVAFDFRMHNPWAVEAFKRLAGPLRSVTFRTLDGHLVKGRSRTIHPTSGSLDPFVAVQAPVQLMGAGVLPLPTLIFNRSYVGMAVDTTEEAPRLAARNWLPFLPASASQESLLLLPGFGVAQTRPNGSAADGDGRARPSRPRPGIPLGGTDIAPAPRA